MGETVIDSIPPEVVAGAGGAAAKTLLDRAGPQPIPIARSLTTFFVGFLVAVFAGPALGDLLGIKADHVLAGFYFAVGTVGQTLLSKFIDSVTRLSPDSVFARAFGVPPAPPVNVTVATTEVKTATTTTTATTEPPKK